MLEDIEQDQLQEEDDFIVKLESYTGIQGPVPFIDDSFSNHGSQIGYKDDAYKPNQSSYILQKEGF